MKKLTAISLALMLLMVVASTEYSVSPSGTTPLTDSQLATLSGMGFWSCAIIATASVALTIGGIAGGPLGILAAGAIGIDATRNACT